MATIESLSKRLESYLPDEQVGLVRRAYHFARDAHEGQYRKDGDPYISHPLAVAGILTDMHMDSQSLSAALLHDVLEDCGVAKERLSDEFGSDVADLVDGVSKITLIEFPTRQEQQAENLRKMILAMTKDIRVILVKLADRLHNMRTLHSLPPAKRKRIAQETLDIFAPIANRLGMNNIRTEFEDLAFAAIYPMRARHISRAVKQVRGNRREVVTKLKETMEQLLKAEGINARIMGREKHLYSIYCKMREQKKSFDEIMDFYGFRIIVDNVDSCYRVLGIMHNYFKPIPGRFKDYIAIPKANGYQSLHTTLKSHGGVPIEVQIRTEDMENMANNGIAAHWLYKGEEEGQRESGPQARARQWMKGLLDIQKQVGNSVEFIENVKIDLFPDEVYIFTPKGDIMELPAGATPVDFAYAVHTSVGNSCVSARIDHRMVPLSTPLQSGQTVEVITAPGAVPSPAWLNFVVTSKARTYIRNFLKTQRKSESVALGQRLLEQSLGEYNVLINDLPIERVVSELAHSGYAHLDDLLEDIGMGNRAAPLVARQLAAVDHLGNNHDGKPLAIRGTEGMVVGYAKCCYPLPGDEIVGHLSAGRGLVVHRHTCRNVENELRDNPERCMALRWEKKVQGDFPVELRVELGNRRGALATLATIIAENDSNIDSINIIEKDAQMGVVAIMISVHDRVHLARIIKRLRRVPGVGRISRGKG
ncbi:MAG: bifunctional GTP diphosphokinase/guanosine-3',5'-bis pyrophosphate 3'-pyrophosphohydrolase [Gammaproteobacteria bacterium]